MASITSSATKKKKRKKKGKKKNKSAEGSVGINSTGESSLVDAWTPQSDVRRCEIICGGCGNSWLPFSISSSPWFKFNVSPSIKAAFGTPIGTTEESVHKWVERAETALSGWVLVDLILKDNRMVQFRSLGRGWVFIFLRREKRQFKVWFESVRRVENGHKPDIERLGFTEEEIRKHTHGYNVETELVFLIKGLVPRNNNCTISIHHIDPKYKHVDKWAASETDIVQKCREMTAKTDLERDAIAVKKLEKEKKKRRRQAIEEALKVSQAEAAKPQSPPSESTKAKGGDGSVERADAQGSSEEVVPTKKAIKQKVEWERQRQATDDLFSNMLEKFKNEGLSFEGDDQ